MSEHGSDFRDMVVQIKLDKEIDKRLKKTDPEFAYYKKLLPNYYVGWDIPEKGLSGKRGNAFTYIRYARQEWWHNLYQRSDISIFDKKYKKAKDDLLASPSTLLKQQVEQLKQDYNSRVQ